MARVADLIHILRRTLIELEQTEYAEYADSETLAELKRSILTSIAEMETWKDSGERQTRQRLLNSRGDMGRGAVESLT